MKATGQTSPPHIPTAGVQCSSCHTNAAPSFLTYAMDHSSVAAARCDSCHNNAYTGQGAKGALGVASYPNHLAPGGRDCTVCHATAAAGFVTWAGAAYSHAATDVNCSNCHDGKAATGLTTPPHVPVAGVQCSNCHTNTATSFVAYSMNHASVSAARCDTCHSGAYGGEGAKGAFGVANYPGHIATAGRDCLTCHASAASGGFVSFAGAVYQHAATDTNCAGCHNGTTATGQTTPPHVPVAGAQCSNCHTNTATSFTSYTMNHASVSAARCDSCHNGSYEGQGTKGAFATTNYAGHVATGGRDCLTCHASAASGGFVSFAGAVYQHAATDTNCSSCHNGTTATGQTSPPHAPTASVQCSNCHTNTATTFVAYAMNHSAVSAARCDSCHNGAFANQGSAGALGVSAFPNHVATTGRDCAACHAASISGGFLAWSGAVYQHAATDTNCVSCHTGTIAKGLTTPPHIPTGVTQCSNCHVNTATSFTTYTMNHPSVASMRCDSCHGGAYAGEGTKGAQGIASYPSHVATEGRDCSNCHAAAAANFTSWSGGAYLHTAADTNCSSCHNNSNALGLTSPPHIPTAALQCSNCHTNTAGSFGVYTMTHAAVASMRCDACHNGAYASEGSKGAYGTASYAGHVATAGRDCSVCHTSAASGGYVTFAGAFYQHAAADTACSSCHNGATATGQTSPPHVPVSGVECSNCHSNTATSFVAYSMNHAAVSAARCDACHNGSFSGQGSKGAYGTANYPGHVATGGRDCTTCHTTAVSGGFVTFAGAVYQHQATDTNCSTCHNGTTATGFTTPPHIPASAVQCSNCHVNTATSFTTYTMNHASVSAARCDSCHNGSFSNQGTSGAYSTANYAGHVATGGRDCVACHATAVSGGFVSFAGAVYQHAATDTNCSTCHNGTTATGFASPPHIPVVGVQCSNCHVNTATSFTTYTMTHSAVSSMRCDACHNGAYEGQGTKGAYATTNYAGHVATTGRDCAACHTAAVSGGYVSFAGAVYQHAATDTNCSTCHNGTTATGNTTPPHIPATGVQCSNCHSNAATSFVAYSMNHASVSAARCDSCHNGAYTAQGTAGAMGTASYPAHVPTVGRDCATCHALAVSGGYVSWAGGLYQHAATDTNCSSCHNGSIATGLTTPPHVPTTGVQCSSCHSNSASTFASYTMNHASVSAARCDACHNGSYSSEGSKGAFGTASYPGHLATAGRDCVACHASAAVNFVSWAGATYQHAATDTVCSSCHNGTTATGQTSPPHVPVTGVECSNCHSNSATSFVSYSMNHTAVTASRCDACHNGTFTGQGAKGAYATTNYPGHVATGGRDCATCHTSAASGGYVTFAGAVYQHAATDTNCSACHNGTTATGNATPPHIPVAGVQCSNCHTNTATSFVTYTMSHAAVTASRCDACHNGSFAGQGANGAYGTANYAGHVATGGRDCVTCHAAAVAGGYVSFAGAVYQHAVTDTNCASCHNGATATGNTTPPHIPIAGVQCSNCHTSTATSFVTYTMNHAAVTTARCDSCHNGSFTSQGKNGALGTSAFAAHVATGGRDCAVCHASAQSGGYVSWTGGVYQHAATDANCSACHNNIAATGLTTPPHIPTASTQCSNCHSNTASSFTTYTMTHSAVSSMRCDACHNGIYATEGSKGALGTASYPNHPPTNSLDCASCHVGAAATFTSWSGGAYQHAATDTNCSNCHNGTAAVGMTTPPHIPTAALQCSNCHVNTAANFTTYTMTHSAVTSMRCDACHNGSYASEGAKGALGVTSYPNHVAVAGRDCATCHATAVSGGYVSWSGGAYVHAATDTACASCHNNTTAKGLTTPPHIPTAALECSNCHTNTASSFTTYTMTHSAVTSMRCDACHSGSYASEGTKGALGAASYPNHVAVAGRDCVLCHASAAASFVSWAGGKYAHLPTDTACASCHNNSTALGLTTPPHIPTAALECSNCHTNTASSFTTYTMTHAAVTSMRCDACHSGSYTSEGAKGATGTAAYAGHVATSGRDCATCHAAAVSGGYVSWAGATYAHLATDTNCSSCHNGAIATGNTSPPHVPATGVQCSNCHVNTATSFTTYTMNHSSVSAARCDTCHNGSFTSQGAKGAFGTANYPGHVATSGRDCAVCHTTAVTGGYVAWSGAFYSHLATDTNCANCHNGSTAQGLTTPPHIPTATLQCSNCHTNTATSFTTYTMSHAAVTSTRCDACHNGSYTVEGAKGALGTASYPNHVATAGRDCAACHATAVSGGYVAWSGGAYVHAATDTNCSACHNGTTALGLKTPPHVPTGATQCSNCHVNTASSFTTYTMTHSAVSSMRCDACHNGSYTGEGSKGALGTSSYPNHVAPAGRDCVTCHAASTASFASWSGGAYVHAATDTNCATCHNGTTALGLTTPPHIPTGATQCSNCHTNTASSFTTYTMTHSAVSSMRCDACHNGSYTGEGSKGAIGTASYPGHVAPAGRDCVACHATAAAAFVTWQGGVYTHLATDTNCSTCHNNTTALGYTTPPHIPATGVQCSNCHSNAAASFVTYTMTHSAVSTMRCDACHNGAYTGEGTKGALGTSSYAGHLPTGSNDCTYCHATAVSGGYVSWSGAKYTHQATDTNCANCHNGSTATGMTTPPHIPTATLQCSNCHTNTATTFTTYTMSHTAVTALRCDACHNGSYTAEGTKGAYGTASYAGHVPTNGNDCVTCHAAAKSGGYVSWSGGTYTHSAADTNCIGCHNGSTATGLTTPPHIPTATLQCSGCHSNTGTSFTASPGYLGMGTTGHGVVHAIRCDTCHNGSYKSQGTSGGARGPDHSAKSVDCGCCHVKSTQNFSSWSNPQSQVAGCTTTAKSLVARVLAPVIRTAVGAGRGAPTGPSGALSGLMRPTIPGAAFDHATVVGKACATCHDGRKAIGKPVRHIMTTAGCDACHKNTRSFAGARVDHASIKAACASCHNGQNALGKPPKHITTTLACETCHKSAASFAVARVDHASIKAACASCHNGQSALGKPPKHITTTLACETCHKSTVSFAAARVDHSAIKAPCASCHNGQSALGKPPRHIPTAAPCEACHKSTRSFQGARVDHAAITAVACATCHSGRTAQGKSPRHVPTSASCDTCHKSTRVFAGARFDHASAFGKPCATCHNGRIAQGKPQRHIQTGAECATCHKNTRSFAVVRVDHAAFADRPCATCHNGRDAIGKPPRHLPTAAPCETCHRDTRSFSARFNHTAVVGTPCATCHNGRDAPGKPPRHAITTAPCDDCHKSTLSFGSMARPTFRGRGMR
ncbi:MAG: hypothetical protein KGM42_18070 [Hyphomicrobiales bacterium]|nr:hypothetical protein [Hyphomicrobiales bacterium]